MTTTNHTSDVIAGGRCEIHRGKYLRDGKIYSIMSAEIATQSHPPHSGGSPCQCACPAASFPLKGCRVGGEVPQETIMSLKTSPEMAISPCHILPLLPPITRSVKLPIRATWLEFRHGPQLPPNTPSQSGKNGNVDPASQHCRPSPTS